MTVTFSEAPAGTSFDARASSVDIPVEGLLTMIMGLIGQGMIGG